MPPLAAVPSTMVQPINQAQKDRGGQPRRASGGSRQDRRIGPEAAGQPARAPPPAVGDDQRREVRPRGIVGEESGGEKSKGGGHTAARAGLERRQEKIQAGQDEENGRQLRPGKGAVLH